MDQLELISGALLVILVSVLWGALVNLVWKPHDMARRFRKQGLRGPPTPMFSWSGSMEEIKRLTKDARGTKMDIHSHDIVPRVLPHYAKWMSQYGENFFFRFGAQTRLCITEVEHVKQVLSNKFGFYPKNAPGPYFLALLGRGLVGITEGSEWARHRRVVSPAFTMDKLKPMTKKMADCTVSMLDSWCGQAEGQHNAIDVNRQFQELTADIISHSTLGSSYKEGKEVFLAQKELLMLLQAVNLNREIPGFKYLPTERNRQMWKLERKTRNTLMNIIQSRLSSKHPGHSNDLLGLMIESTQMQEGTGLNMDEIVEECNTFFFVGQETTSNLLTWTMFLLSTNQDWQEKLREEVMSECGMEIPSTDNLSKFKLVSMVLFETLRLYTPITLIVRKAAQDMNLGNLMIPKGTILTLPLAVIHHNKDLWGDDANEFNPDRFQNGVTKAAKHPNALLAFSMGPRVCVGQNFVMLEAKMVIALILQRFAFSLSPDYKHEPADRLTLQPESGLPIVFKPLAI